MNLKIKYYLITILIAFLLPLLFQACNPLPIGKNTQSAHPTPHPLGVDCPLPCYKNITPGTTTYHMSIQSLQADPDVITIRKENQLITWRERGKVEGHLLLEDNIVTTISLHYLEASLSLKTLLEKLGAPDYLHITLPHPRQSPDPKNSQCDVLRLVYERIDAEIVTHDRRSGEVQPGHTVQRFTLSPNRSTRAILTPFYKREWEGYGNYCIPVEDIFQD